MYRSTVVQIMEYKKECVQLMEYRTTVKYEYRSTRVQHEVVKECKCTGEQDCSTEIKEYKIKSTGFQMYKSKKAQYYRCLGLQDYMGKRLQVYGRTGKLDMYIVHCKIVQ